MYIRLYLRIYALILGAVFFAASAAGAAAFEKLERGHFVIYHLNRDLANDLTWKAEYYYKKILGHLGSEEFRPWESKDKCEIYIYKTKAEYMAATGAPEWSAGLAQDQPLRFSAYEGSPDMETTTFPHELTHIIFRLFTDRKRMPLWLEEGMAQFEEEDQSSLYKRKRFVKWSVKNGSYIRLADLMNMAAVPEDNLEGFYSESASVVDHLITDNIRTSYGKFLTCLKNGRSVEAALKEAYQRKYKNGASDLELRWLEFIRRKY